MSNEHHHYGPDAFSMLIDRRRKHLFELRGRWQRERCAVDQELMTFARHSGLPDNRHADSIEQLDNSFLLEPLSGLVVRTVAG